MARRRDVLPDLPERHQHPSKDGYLRAFLKPRQRIGWSINPVRIPAAPTPLGAAGRLRASLDLIDLPRRLWRMVERKHALLIGTLQAAE